MSIPELMQSLDVLVKAGKVLYLGISNSPAWVVSSANQYARDHGLAQFCVYQGKWSVAEREVEHEILDMIKHEGMGICAWNVLGGGRFRGKPKEDDGGRGEDYPVGLNDPRYPRVIAALESVAKRHSTTPTTIALAYVSQKVPHAFPIIGGRKVEHFRSNIEALRIRLTPEDYAELDEAAPLATGFPYEFIGHSAATQRSLVGNYRFVDGPKAITPQ
jgi:aryl-alcohol dehydrogenase-like predicted oxidoreductase